MKASSPFDRLRLARSAAFPGLLMTVFSLAFFFLNACAHQKPLTALSGASSGVPSSCATSQACFEEAIEARRQGDSTLAVELLKKIPDHFPRDRWAARAVFLSGKWESEEGRPEAQAHLERAMTELPELQDYAFFYLGQAALLRGDFIEAMTRFDDLKTRTPRSIWIPQAWYRSGEAAFKAGLYPQARQRFEAFREISPNDHLVPSALVYIGRSYLEESQSEQAVSTLRQVWIQWPDLPQAQEAQSRLDQLQTQAIVVPAPAPEDRLLRARRLAAAMRYDQALKESEALFKTEADGPLRRSLYQLIGSLQYQLRRFDSARETFETLAKDPAGSPEYPEIALWLGKIAYRVGDETRLAQFEEELAARLEGRARPERARLLFLLASLYEDQQKPEEARAVYQRLEEAFPSDPLAQEASWRLGWMAYRAGRWGQAVAEFERFLLSYPQSPLVIQVLYWKAKGLERLGENALAVSAYRRPCGITRHSYYCHRAEERLKVLQVAAASSSVPAVEPKLSDPISLPEPEGTAILVPEDAPLYPEEAPLLPEEVPPLPQGPLPPSRDALEVVASPVVSELFLLGLETEAADELNRLVQENARNRERFLALNRILSDRGRYARALRNLKLYAPEFLDKIGDDLPPDFWRIAYPQGIREEVGQFTKEIPVDADLVTAMIREESSYDPDAVSPVGALGLMQLMPATAHWVAKRMNLGPFSRDQLYVPSVNIQLGARYLTILLDRFEGDLISAVAAYNAGPELVTRWKEWISTSDPDEFVEAIPYQETRYFVKRVLRSYYEYRRRIEVQSQPTEGIGKEEDFLTKNK